MRGIAARRAAKQRAVRHAEHVLKCVWGNTALPAYKWADNLKKCSCPMCNSGNPHDHRQFKRADAKMTFDLNDDC